MKISWEITAMCRAPLIIALLVLVMAAGPTAADEPASVTEKGLTVTVAPTQPVFAVGEGPKFTVTFRNDTKDAMTLSWLGSYRRWVLTCGNWQAESLEAVIKQVPDVVLAAGKQHAVEVDLSKRFQWNWVGPVARRREPANQLPEGEYTFTAEVQLANGPDKDVKYWVGTIKTKPVAFKIGEAFKPAGTDPAGLPLTARLVVKQDTCEVPSDWQAEGFREKLQTMATSGQRLPNPPAVQMALEITNTSDKAVTIVEGSDMSMLELQLIGPGALSVKPRMMMTRELRMGREVTIAPGKSATIDIPRLAWGMRGVGGYAYWTKPGTYRLQAGYQTPLTGEGLGLKPGQRVTVTAEPVTLTVKAADGEKALEAEAFKAMLTRMGDADFRIREKATEELQKAATAAAVQKQIEAALADDKLDPEVAARLRRVLQGARGEPDEEPVPARWLRGDDGVNIF